MDVNEFEYELPEELIAQKPSQKRDESRLLCLNRKTGAIDHNIFKDLIKYLNKDDLLVLNNSRVIPARLYGKKIPTGTEVEFLLLNELENDYWEVLVKPGRRLKKGTSVSFGGEKLIAHIEDYTDFGGRIVKLEYSGDFDQLLQELGEMPLPPYIRRKLVDQERYQTVYAREKGSVAAPTAGLHFTKELLGRIENKGISIEDITLHVGLGTFRPVRAEKVEDHEMHSEYYSIDSRTADKINQTANSQGRIIAVGTTVTRTLEAAVQKTGEIAAGRGWTDLFIYPGYEFKIIEGLITNFHLPRSTLLMLVSAFAGKDRVMNAYQRAVEKKYRFYSFGDAMFIY